MELIEKLTNIAKSNKQRVVLAEGAEPRTIQAADKILANGIADVILLGNPAEIAEQTNKFDLKNITKATIIDPTNHPKKEEYAQMLFELRKKKGMTIEQARDLVENPLYLACLAIKSGDADCEVTGAVHTTGDVLRAAFQVIKTAPGISSVSGAFIMLLKDKSFGKDGLMVFADCAVIPNPTAAELAQIASCTADTAKNIGQMEPSVAMLSFSTKGSAKNEMVDKIVEATALAKQLRPDLLIDGEMQADAAIIPSIGEQKAPGSPVAGHANVLVFPNLEVGNIAYKLVQRTSGAVAIGPILQGLAAPVSDLSRGASSDDIFQTIIITCNQSIAMNKK